MLLFEAPAGATIAPASRHKLPKEVVLKTVSLDKISNTAV